MTPEERRLLTRMHEQLDEMREHQGWVKAKLEGVHAATAEIPNLLAQISRHNLAIRVLFTATAGGIITTTILVAFAL